MTSISAVLGTYTATATQRANIPETSKKSDTGSQVATDTVSLSPRALELMQRRSITDQERIAFKDILNKSAAAGAHDNPEQFLKNLSTHGTHHIMVLSTYEFPRSNYQISAETQSFAYS